MLRGALIHTGPSLIYSSPEEVCRASPGVDPLSFFLFCPHDYIRALCAGDHRHASTASFAIRPPPRFLEHSSVL